MKKYVDIMKLSLSMLFSNKKFIFIISILFGIKSFFLFKLNGIDDQSSNYMLYYTFHIIFTFLAIFYSLLVYIKIDDILSENYDDKKVYIDKFKNIKLDDIWDNMSKVIGIIVGGSLVSLIFSMYIYLIIMIGLSFKITSAYPIIFLSQILFYPIPYFVGKAIAGDGFYNSMIYMLEVLDPRNSFELFKSRDYFSEFIKFYITIIVLTIILYTSIVGLSDILIYFIKNIIIYIKSTYIINFIIFIYLSILSIIPTIVYMLYTSLFYQLFVSTSDNIEKDIIDEELV